MTNIIIATHGDFGAYLAQSAEMIAGEQKEGVEIFSVSSRMSADAAAQKFAELVEKINGGDLLVFTDILGGTPTNVAVMALKDKQNSAIITGVNLAMLVSAFSYRAKMPLAELAAKIIDIGKKSAREVKELLANSM